MTENEAIRHCEERAKICDECGKEHKQLAEWLKELLKYREICTVGEIKSIKKYIDLKRRCGTPTNTIDVCAEYIAIGTVEECREAVEKQKPKKPGRTGMDEQDYYTCPNCGADIGSTDDYFPRDRYCHECGQNIRWEKNMEGMKDEWD